MPIFYCIIPSEYLGAFENFPVYILGFLEPLIIWFIVVMKGASSVFYPLPCDAHSWAQSSWFSCVVSHVSTLRFWAERLTKEAEDMGDHSSGLAFR